MPGGGQVVYVWRISEFARIKKANKPPFVTRHICKAKRLFFRSSSRCNRSCSSRAARADEIFAPFIVTITP